MCCELVNVGKCMDTGIAGKLEGERCSFFVYCLYFLSKIRIQAKKNKQKFESDR